MTEREIIKIYSTFIKGLNELPADELDELAEIINLKLNKKKRNYKIICIDSAKSKSEDSRS